MPLHHVADKYGRTYEVEHSTAELGSTLRTSSDQCIPLTGRALGKSTRRAPKEVYHTQHCSQTLYIVLLGTARYPGFS